MERQEVGWEGMSQTDLARNRYRWWAHVIAVMNLQGKYNAGNFLTS